jgi:hypothetical protein
MALIVTHARVLAIADDITHPEQVQPTDWGSTASAAPTHVITGTIDPDQVDLTGYVVTSDVRLSDARVPLAHTQAFATITATPTSLAGYGILDAVVLGTRTVNGHALSADVTVTKSDVGLGNVENVALSTGNAATATALATARAINGVNFDGSAAITVTAAAGTLTGATLAATVLASSLTSVGTLATLTVTAPIVGSVTGSAASATGNAATATLAAAATVLATPRTINGVSFNGSANITVSAATLTTPRAINGVNFDGSAAITVTAAAGTLTGTTLAATVVTSSLTSVGALTSLVVGGAIASAPAGVEGYFASTSASDPRGLMSAQYSTDAVGARFHLRKGRGTEAVPTTVVTGDVLGRIRFSGYDGVNYLQMASIDAVSTGTIAATRVPTYLAFSVATDAAPSVLTEVLRLAPGLVTVSAALTITGGNLTVSNGIFMPAAGTLLWTSRYQMSSPAGVDGHLTLQNYAATSGVRIKTDALPTVASGGGTSPSVTAGSTALAGSVNVGTGGVATSIVINFNGTAFPSAPFVVCMNTTTGAVVRAVASTTQLTITAPVAFVASDVIAWHCISSK